MFGASKSVAYNDIGNITSNLEIRCRALHLQRLGRGLGAAACVGPSTGTSGGAFRPATSYAYDANGAMTSGNGATTTWTAFGKVLTMAKGTTSLSWAYDPDHHRAKQSSTVGGSLTDTYYFADAASGVMAEFVDGPSLTALRHA